MILRASRSISICKTTGKLLTKRATWLNFTFAITGTLLFFGFGAYALWLGKEALLSDLLKVVVGALGGGGLGFYLGSKKSSQQNQQ